jgi:two-component system NtrC family sensor kinase
MNISTDILFSIPIVMAVERTLSKFVDMPVRLPAWAPWLRRIWVPAVVLFMITVLLQYKSQLIDDVYAVFAGTVLLAMLARLSDYRPARTLLLAGLPFYLFQVVDALLQFTGYKLHGRADDIFGSAGAFTVIWLITFVLIARSQKKSLEQAREAREAEEQERLRITAQNAELERQVAARTTDLMEQAKALRHTVTELKTTQAQLIQSEKMASLGELTAGIAHEIQNPLNFVNNFAEVSVELLTELEEEQQKPDRDLELEADLLADLKQNLLKISQHGGRASSIVRGMLEHSRQSTGERVPTDLNALADEYLRLAYHGLRAKDKSFNATLQPDFDPSLPPVSVIAQDLGRVLLNLLTNAFYAVRQRQKAGEAGYVPTVSVSTQRVGPAVVIRVRDNGTGMPDSVKAKIFQPFFTTKPTGEGTGLGLSLSYDIITQGHGGSLAVTSEEGEGTEFIVTLPV